MTHFILRICLGVILIMPAFTPYTPAYASEEKKEDGEEASREDYIKVPPVIVTMYHKGRPKGNMTITLTLKVTDSEKHATAVKYLPRLSNAYIMESSRLSHDYFDVKRPVNIRMLADALQGVTNAVLKHKEARVLISDVIVNNR
ncbi:hypothetical protein MNBD_ALPHA02-938 [hydrothermal vent metagenome]|uniref:Flagellar protein FliL n=1 Tax=hydrothermal vent metagenome TaxID=652676 RepID=A0A3B0R897_9ZZZZ